MKRTIYLLILLVVTGAMWIAEAQSERRDRDRDRRDRDRNYNRERDNNNNRDRESYRTRESQPQRPATSTTTTNSAPATVAISERQPEPEVEIISTNSGPVDPFSYQAFRIVAQRNIFDPNRRVRTQSNEAPPERPKRIENFTLLGAIAYDKGNFAFFEGSNSDYRKSVKAGDSIGGLKVAEVAPNHVTFEAGEGKTLELPVGSQMKRTEGEEWKVGGRAESGSTSSTSSSSSTDSSSSGGTSSGNGEASDVLKRLLEKAKRGE
jgi:hypothetical protein